MAVRIVEYFGQRVSDNQETIQPVSGQHLCPFMNAFCSKLLKGLKPVCSVQKADGENWIVCSQRLCSTNSQAPLSEYQKGILLDVAKCIFGNDVEPEDIAIKREQTIPVVESSKYHADYIMTNIGKRGRKSGQQKVILEMQGGGETSSTGSLTRLVQNWEDNPDRTNDMLFQKVAAAPIVTNAWRRQQEQFIIKGNIAQQTGGGLVFCVGKPLYDYLEARFRDASLNDLREHNWTLAILAFKQDLSVDGKVNYVLDEERQLFTNYVSFVQRLINQGIPHPQMFTGRFELLNGDLHYTEED